MTIDAVELYSCIVNSPRATGPIHGRFLIAAYDRDQAQWIAERWAADKLLLEPSIRLRRDTERRAVYIVSP